VALSTTPAQAQLADISGRSNGALEQIARDLHKIARGTCTNYKIC